jgi:hypothetical protein
MCVRVVCLFSLVVEGWGRVLWSVGLQNSVKNFVREDGVLVIKVVLAVYSACMWKHSMVFMSVPFL